VTMLVVATALSWPRATAPTSAGTADRAAWPGAGDLAVADLAGTGTTSALTAPRTAARVVIVVGPAGSATDRYRAEAEDAAAIARRLSSDVVTIYSPEATWDRVQPALQGASIVVYLGHGNGWPSPHRSELFPLTQNGLGLNPVSGGGDVQHQYFGEQYLRDHVRLAPGAVVLLHHLCYASGTSEPGVVEGPLAVAEQRVDNFAAGWLDAGAAAVVAEARIGPAFYLEGLLSGSAAVDVLWDTSPARRGHHSAFDSVRVPGARAMLDPDREWSGFYRSLVLGSGPDGSPDHVAPFVALPSLAAAGLTIGTPELDAAPLTGATARVSVPFALPDGVGLPEGVQLATQWMPIEVEPLPPPGDASVPGVGPNEPNAAQPVDPDATESAEPEPSPLVSPDPAASDMPGDAVDVPADQGPPAIDLVSPDLPGEVVDPRPATNSDGAMFVDTLAPRAPGLYRLVVTLHAPDGRAFDVATQSLVPALTVRVSLPLSVRFGLPGRARVAPGGMLQLDIRVANTGRLPWDLGVEPGTPRRGDRIALEEPVLVARWLELDGDERAAPMSVVPVRVAPGTSEVVTIGLVAPLSPGTYLVVLDVQAPLFGSLVASGIEPGVIRVEVLAAGPSTDPIGTAT